MYLQFNDIFQKFQVFLVLILTLEWPIFCCLLTNERTDDVSHVIHVISCRVIKMANYVWYVTHTKAAQRSALYSSDTNLTLNSIIYAALACRQ